MTSNLVTDAGTGRPFFWATATAAYQVEGGLHGTDWHQWEYQPDGGEFPADAGHIAHNDHADQGDDEYEKYAQDFDLAQQLGTNAMRISIEWARVEPTEGHYDAEAIAHYHAVLKALRDRHITPMVTLQHFSLPLWIHDCYHPENGYGGWAGRDVRGAVVYELHVGTFTPEGTLDAAIGRLDHLVDLGVDTLVITGTTTSGCVRSTTIDAFSYNYRVVVPSDAVYDRGITSHKVNLFDMAMKYADVRPTSEVLTSLEGLPVRGDD